MALFPNTELTEDSFKMWRKDIRDSAIREFHDRLVDMLQERTGFNWGRNELKERMDLIRDAMLDE